MTTQQQTPGTSQPQIDPTALNLSRAIRSVEGGDYNNTSGDAGTSKGAYQWQPGNFEAAAKQYGLDPNDFSPTNQDHVAYEQIAEQLKQGKTQSQVASWWNSGKYDPTDNVGDRVINGKTIHFDTPAYVAKVQKAYEALSNNTGYTPPPAPGQAQAPTHTADIGYAPPTPPTPIQQIAPEQETSNDDSLWGKIKSFAEDALPIAGSIVGGIGGALAGGTIASPSVLGIPAAAYAGGVAGSGLGAAGGEALKEKLQGKNINGVDVATQGVLGAGSEAIGAPVVAGAGKLLGVTGETLYKNVGMVKTAADYAAKAKDAIIDAITPRVVGKAYQKAGKAGLVGGRSVLEGTGVQGADMKEVQNAYEGITSAAQALGKKVTDIIKPGIATATENLNRINSTISDYAQKVVKPFYDKLAQEPHLDDFISTIKGLPPPPNLSQAAMQSWKQMQESTIAMVSSHMKGEYSGLTSLARLRNASTNGALLTKPKGNFWDARKIIDDVYDEATKGKAFTDESLVGAKAGYKSMREAFKNFLSDMYRYPGQADKVNAAHEFLRTPEGRSIVNKGGFTVEDFEKQFGLVRTPESTALADAWDKHMSTLSGLYDARNSIATKIGSERGMTGLKAFQANHPIANGILKYGAHTAGVGAGIAGAEGLLAPK